MQRDCESLSDKFGDVSERAKQQGVRETSGFTETVHLFLDLIISYQELCERRERTVQRKHQKALAKVHTMVNYKERMESTGKHLVSRERGVPGRGGRSERGD
jgi:sorting nexin-8